MARGLSLGGVLLSTIVLVTVVQMREPPAHAQPNDVEALGKRIAELHDAGKFAEAIPLAERLIELARSLSGEASIDMAERVKSLARLYNAERRYDEAEQTYKRALAINEKVFGADHPNLQPSLYDLAGFYWEQRRYPEAETLSRRGLAIAEKLQGVDHKDTLTWINNLAQLHKAQGGYGEAIPYLKRALAINEKVLGRDHPDLRPWLHNLAELYWAQGRYAEAEPLYARNLAIAEKKSGAEHPYVSESITDVAYLYQAQGRFAQAEPLLKRVLTIAEKQYGTEHPSVSTRLNDLALLYEAQGRLSEAEPLYKRALAINEKTLGPDHPDTAIVRGNLGGLYKSLGRRGEAEQLLKSALAAKEKVLGLNHPSVAYTLTQIADLYRLLGQCEKAEPLIVRALTIAKGDIEEVPILFGTDRKPDSSQLSVTFGAERSQEVSLGLAVVMVAKDARAGKPKGSTGTETATERRLALRCLQTVNDKQLIDIAVRRLALSKTFQNQIFVFVHGYNVSFDNAVRRAAQMAYDLKFDGGTFLFSWPSRGQLDFRAYFSDRETVDIAAEHLRQFLEKVVSETKATKVHFVAHSMGNLVLLQALEKINAHAPSLAHVIGEVIAAAPDVDTDVFQHIVGRTKARGTTVTLYASQSDRALWLSGWLRKGTRAGFISENKPLIISGVDTIDITKAGTGLFGLNHDVYSSSASIVADIRRIFELGERPPDKRTSEFEQVRSKEGVYWRLRAPEVRSR